MSELTQEQKKEISQLCTIANRPKLAHGFINAGMEPKVVLRALSDKSMTGALIRARMEPPGPCVVDGLGRSI